MTTATDPKTGQRYELLGGRWVPITGGGSSSSEPTQQQSQQREADRKLYAPDSGGAFNAALIGAGDTFNNASLNVRDMWNRLTGDEAGQQKVAEDRQEAGMVRGRIHESNPVAATVGSMLPSLAASYLGGAGALGQIATGGAIGGVTGESGDLLKDFAMSAAMGGAGMGAQGIVGRVVAGRTAYQAQKAGLAGAGGGGLLNDAEREVIEGARRSGLAVTPGQTSGSKAMRDFESQLAVVPGAGAIFGEIQQANRQQVNRLAARAMGIEANNVGPEVRAAAEMQLAQKFEAIGQQIGTVNTKAIRQKFETLAAEEATQGLPTSAGMRLRSLYEKGLKGREEAAAGTGEQMTGEMLMQMRSEASSRMRQAFNAGKSTEGQTYAEAVNAIDGTIHKSALASGGHDLADAYRQARSEWNVLRTMNHGGASIDGNVQPAQAMRLLRGGDETGLFGRGDVAGLTTQTRGSGIIGQNPHGDFYDALRFVASPIGRDSLPMTGARLGTALQLNGVPGVAMQVAKRLAAAPMAKAYANLSPEAASVAAATIQGLRQPAPSPAIVDILRTAGAGAFGGGL